MKNTGSDFGMQGPRVSEVDPSKYQKTTTVEFKRHDFAVIEDALLLIERALPGGLDAMEQVLVTQAFADIRYRVLERGITPEIEKPLDTETLEAIEAVLAQIDAEEETQIGGLTDLTDV